MIVQTKIMIITKSMIITNHRDGEKLIDFEYILMTGDESIRISDFLILCTSGEGQKCNYTK